MENRDSLTRSAVGRVFAPDGEFSLAPLWAPAMILMSASSTGFDEVGVVFGQNASDEGTQRGHRFERGIDGDDLLGDRLRLGHDLGVAKDRQVPQRGSAPLGAAENIALTAGVEVVFGQSETVEGIGDRLQAPIALMPLAQFGQ